MSRGRLKPEDEKCIRVNYMYIQEQLEAKDIVNFLYQHEVISLDDKEKICIGKSQLERNEELLSTLQRCGPGEAFNWFLKSLEDRYSYILKEIQRKAEEGSVLEKQQKHIDRLQDDYDNQIRENQSLKNKLGIMSRGRLKPEDEECIRVNYIYLQNQLEAKDIVNFLYQHKVISLDDKERICGGKSQLERNEELLSTLLRCGPGEAFNWFLKSLEDQYILILKEIQRKEEGSVLEKQHKHIDRLQDDYDNQIRENQSLKNKLAKLQEKNTAQLEEINELNETQDAYQEQRDSLEDEINSLTIIKAELQEKNTAQAEEINGLKKTQVELQEKNKTQAKEINGLKQTQDEYQEQRKSMEDKINSFTIKQESLERKLYCIESDIDLLLIGRSGVGKSALGNSILNRKIFRCSCIESPVTKCVQIEKGLINDLVVDVVDTPGFLHNKLEDKGVRDAISSAFCLDRPGYHAILFVFKYDSRFGKEVCDTLDFYKSIFGTNFVKDFCILVLNCGDHFEKDSDKTFQQWCEQQRGELGKLIKECNNRVVLFDNITRYQSKIDLQRKNLIQMVDNLCKDRDRRFQIRFMNEAK